MDLLPWFRRIPGHEINVRLPSAPSTPKVTIDTVETDTPAPSSGQRSRYPYVTDIFGQRIFETEIRNEQQERDRPAYQIPERDRDPVDERDYEREQEREWEEYYEGGFHDFNYGP